MSVFRSGLLLLPLILWGCGDDPPETAPAQPAEIRGVVPEAGDDPVRPDIAPGSVHAIEEAPGLASLAADTARGWTGPGGHPFEVTLRTPGRRGHLSNRIGMETFDLTARVTNRTLTQYPCTSCHEGLVDMADRVADAHRNIQPVHPARTGATCATCHLPDSVQYLRLTDGQAVSMDHAYQLCAECHQGETRSWAAGVHGKRVEGWHGRRVIMNCADCHDPHRPALESRIPYPGPVLPGPGGGPP